MTVDFNALRKPRTVTREVANVGECTFKIMSGATRQAYINSLMDLKAKYPSDEDAQRARLDMYTSLIWRTLVNANDCSPVFVTQEEIGELEGDIIDELYIAAIDAQGMSTAAREQAEKN
jgi:hypothetical protein